MRLVGSNTELKVTRIDFEREELLASEISSLHPDIVMMGQETTFKLELLFHLIFKNRQLKKLRVIIFHGNDNFVDIYTRKSMRTLQSTDFLAMVQGMRMAC